MISPRDGDLCLLFNRDADALSGRSAWMIGEIEGPGRPRIRCRERNMKGNKAAGIPRLK